MTCSSCSAIVPSRRGSTAVPGRSPSCDGTCVQARRYADGPSWPPEHVGTATGGTPTLATAS
jgi:hypothetical protein